MGKIINLDVLEKTKDVNLEIIQLSTPTCPPCRMMKAFIENNYDLERIGYNYVNVHQPVDQRVGAIIDAIGGLQSVPVFVVIEDETTILGHWKGANMNAFKNYVEYVEEKYKLNELTEELREEEE